MTSWHRNEYILKGLFLGLWAFFALQVPSEPSAALKDIAWVVGWVGVGLGVALVIGIFQAFSRGLRPWQNWGAFPVVVLLESASFIYTGIVAGLVVGVFSGTAGTDSWAGPLAARVGLSLDDIRHQGRVANWLGYCAIGGAILGFGLMRLRQVPDPWRRFLMAGVIGVAGAYLIVSYSEKYLAEEAILRASKETREAIDQSQGDARTQAKQQLRLMAGGLQQDVAGMKEKRDREQDQAFNTLSEEVRNKAKADYFGSKEYYGLYLLLCLPFFYLLTFCGDADESVVEAATFSAILAAGLFLYDIGNKNTIDMGGTIAILTGLAVYFTYSTRIMPGLRVFKHIVRGYAYMNVSRLRDSLYFFRQATEMDNENPLARQGMIHLHDSLSLAKLEKDPELAEVLDFNLCLDRAGALLARPPAPTELAEANRFLDMVETKKPVLQGRVDYLRVIALAHAKDYDTAGTVLCRLLSPETPYFQIARRKVLFRAWVLAVKGPAELTRRSGYDELRKPGRRIEAIGAVERELAQNPNEITAKELKVVFYSQLTEPEFVAASTQGPPKDLDYAYVEQLGLALVDDPDPERRERGVGYLRIAGRGAPDRGPGIFRKLAQVAEHAGDRDTMRGYLEQVKRCAAAVGGPAHLPRDQREMYGTCVRRLADEAEARGDAFKKEADAADERGDKAGMAARDAEARPYYEAAIDNIRLYLDGGGRNELDAYRKLAEIYSKARSIPHAVMNALLNTETGLTYSSTDADLLKKKDSYYYSVDAEELMLLRDRVKGYFDVSYCIRKAMSVLNAKEDNLELVEWAAHLAKLARVMQPTSNGVRLVEARCMLRKGEREEGIRIMEAIRAGRRGSGEDEDAWFAATKILGQLYLEELNRPQDALRAFQDYKDYTKSGADTLFQIARCHEALGDPGNALRFYEAVTVYAEHPRAWEAQEAIKRLRGGQAG